MNQKRKKIMENLLEKEKKIEPLDQEKVDIKQILMDSPIYQHLEKEEVEKLVERIVGYFADSSAEKNN